MKQRMIPALRVSVHLLVTTGVFGSEWVKAQEGEDPVSSGAVRISPRIFESIEKVAPIAGAAIDEPVVSLRKRFPTPRNQGTMNACVPFAACYAIKTYLERTRNGWADTDNSEEHVFSPAFIYNQIELQTPDEPLRNRGMLIQSALSIMEGAGCCTWGTLPYNGITAYAFEDDAIWTEAARYRKDKWDAIDIKKIPIVRQYLSSGRPIIIGATVDVAQNGRWALDGSGVTNSLRRIRTGYHAMVLLGYDDSKGVNGEGAFEIMNSWGPEWNDHGFGWVSYSFWPNFVNEGYVVWDTRSELRNLPLPAGVSLSEIRWLPPGPEGKKNGNWGYPADVNLKDLKPTADNKFPDIVRELNQTQSP
jgi:hypothetical protein